MNLTLTLAVAMIATGVLALLVGVVFEATTHSPREPEQETGDMNPNEF